MVEDVLNIKAIFLSIFRRDFFIPHFKGPFYKTDSSLKRICRVGPGRTYFFSFDRLSSRRTQWAAITILMGYNLNKPILVWWYRLEQFSSDQIVCSWGEPFHKKQPGYFILRMIIPLLFEPFRNLSLHVDHLRFVCAIWHDRIHVWC